MSFAGPKQSGWPPQPNTFNLLYWSRFALALFCAAAIGFGIHVLYGRGWAEAYVQAAAVAGRLPHVHEPYPTYVVVVAFVTELLVVAGKIAAYILLRDALPGHSRLTKGLWFGLLLLGMSDALIRLPLMNYVVGNPVDVVFVQSLEGWLIGAATGVAIALLVP
jgi:hypothetical protein